MPMESRRRAETCTRCKAAAPTQAHSSILQIRPSDAMFEMLNAIF